MNRLLFFWIALAAAVPSVAQDKPQPGGAEQSTSEPTPPKLKTLMQDCDAHKFETAVQSVVDGKPHMSKVKMCGVEGQSDAEWIDTLKDAVAKLEANKEMAPSTRDQIITAVKAEIARLESGTAKPATTTDLPKPPSSVVSSSPLTNDYSILPPLPNNPPPQTHVLPPAEEAAAVAGPSPDVAPTEAPKPVETAVSPPVVQPAPAKTPAKPRLTFSCINAEYPGGGQCISLSRDTVLTVRAQEDLPAGLSLRFIRGGMERGIIDLGAIRNRQSINYRLPSDVCRGVNSAEVEVDVYRNGQRVDRRGPYLLHC
jgi:hypothetical protein